ncbi:DUF4382 domain-containing protein [Sunxiuqinia dokdonensis]|uniref:DUF4382 domain-containing protein n=1 Tax=Sunxiuqinia dokdonensis TaxID=1409788 RepID=A0A0L8V3Z8_9BACT|nr:DUF4382 domain-containing protein [Sunxiuqinia dokdonensis]KOH42967.1 hypothetical protein NC99_41830 [Sunxiuqinia dokdonensis]
MKTKISILLVLFIFSMVAISCSDDDDVEKQHGELNVKVTDAPSDDANIQGTFVTISEVKIDGQVVEGFTAQTIEISAYQNGNTKLLVNETLEAESYNSVSLVLDYENDAEGNSPGCYVLTDDDNKHALEAASSSTTEVTFNKPFQVEANGMTDLVIDFDLRKAIVRNEDGGDSEYKFVTSAELTNSLRIVQEDECGAINGEINNHTEAEGELVIYAYKKGSFDAETETQGQGNSQVMFANAETSAKVATDGSYKLSFLEEGEYEVHVASYEEDANGQIAFTGMVQASSSISGLLLNNVSVEANSQVNLNIDLSILADL